MLDDAVFARGVQGLKNEQESPAVLGVKHFLQMTEADYAVVEQILRGMLTFDAVGV